MGGWCACPGKIHTEGGRGTAVARHKWQMALPIPPALNKFHFTWPFQGNSTNPPYKRSARKLMKNLNEQKKKINKIITKWNYFIKNNIKIFSTSPYVLWKSIVNIEIGYLFIYLFIYFIIKITRLIKKLNEITELRPTNKPTKCKSGQIIRHLIGYTI